MSILSAAIAALHNDERLEIVQCSAFYRTAPVGHEQQDDFLNAVCEVRTSLNASELLKVLQAVEHDAGRERSGLRWGPRTLDIDLLLFGELQLATPELTLPHPRMHERAFVLYPLQEIAPGLIVPGAGAVDQLAKACAGQTIMRLG
jgi:2-amino-4-hydroxy-6-hydroxymethyldihydropteridine diphosphokinase